MRIGPIYIMRLFRWFIKTLPRSSEQALANGRQLASTAYTRKCCEVVTVNIWSGHQSLKADVYLWQPTCDLAWRLSGLPPQTVVTRLLSPAAGILECEDFKYSIKLVNCWPVEWFPLSMSISSMNGESPTARYKHGSRWADGWTHAHASRINAPLFDKRQTRWHTIRIS